VTKADEVRKWALSDVGATYVLGNEPWFNEGGEPSSDPLASDCSGLVYGCFRKAFVLVNGKPLPRLTANDYYHMATKMRQPERCGDLGFLVDLHDHAYHTFLCIGRGQVVEAGFNHKVRLTTIAVENARSGIRWGRLNSDIGYLTEAAPTGHAPLRAGGLYLANPYLHGHDVSWAQHCLWKSGVKGYTDKQVDGTFGPITKSAVEIFQKDRNMPVTGKVDEATYAAMNMVPGI
jgi:cell wall-associated NlpC family hydrolase